MLSPFATTLLEYLSAGYPALAVTTHEEDRLLADVRTLGDARWSHATWTITRGWVLGDGTAINRGAGNPIHAIDAIRALPERTLAVFLDLHPYLSQSAQAAAVVRSIRDTLEFCKAEGRPLLLCSPELRFPVELQKDVAVLEYALPRRSALQELLGDLARERVILEDAIVTRIVDSARGLTWNEAENAFSLALVRHQHEPEKMPGTVQREKTALVKKQGVLELLEPRETLAEVGGLDQLKALIEAHGALIEQTEQALTWGFQAGDLPKGILLLGPPGTGKSLVARAIAGTWRVPLLRLNLSRILGSRVGQSEQQLDQAIQLATAMAPCVLHSDEIEKALAGGGSAHLDAGVMSRVVGQFLTWLQERHADAAPVYVVATANRIDLLPPELSRAGRFDQIVFVDLPEADERGAVAQIHLAKRRQRIPDSALAELAQDTDRFSPAEIEQVVKQACIEAFRANRQVEPKDLLRARRQITPLADSRADEIAALREWARTRAMRASSVSTTPASRRAIDFAKN